MDKGIEALIEDLKFYGGESGCHPDPHYWLEFERLATAANVLALIAALEQAHQENKSQLAALTNTVELWNEQRTRIAELEKTLRETEESLIAAVDQIAELESAPNGMMQLSNELAEIKRNKFAVKLPAPRISYGGIEVYHPHIVIEAIKNAGGTVERIK